MAFTDIQKVRLAVADTSVELPILDDESYSYFLEKNNNSINRASLDAAKTILLTLSQRTSTTVDVLSITGTAKAAEQYRLALQMFLKDPSMNSVLTNCQGYAGGISLTDMQANVDNPDNNFVHAPDELTFTQIQSEPDYFKV
jgi:hypothetical protein